MPQLLLNKSNIDNIQASNKQDDYFDTDISGFGLRVNSKSKTFFVLSRVGGKQVRYTIGRYGILTPAEARREAKAILGDMQRGINPNTKKRTERKRSITLREAFSEYISIRKPKPSTLSSDKSLINCHLSKWLDKPLAEITKDMVAKRHLELLDTTSKHTANNVFRLFKRVYNCINSQMDDLLPQNPTSRISATKQWAKVGRRQTIIADCDLPAWYRAVRQTSNLFMRNYILILLFTGLRKQEGLKLEWKNVNMVDKTFTLQETKNSKPLTTPISNYLFELFSELHAAKLNDYVFPAFVKEGKHGHMTEPKRQIQAITKMSDVSFCLHDLRRVFKTQAQDTVTKAESDRLTNHSSRDAGDGYIILSTEKVREPMQRITDKLLCMTGAWSDWKTLSA